MDLNEYVDQLLADPQQLERQARVSRAFAASVRADAAANVARFELEDAARGV